jgi:hypothetical protein
MTDNFGHSFTVIPEGDTLGLFVAEGGEAYGRALKTFRSTVEAFLFLAEMHRQHPKRCYVIASLDGDRPVKWRTH